MIQRWEVGRDRGLGTFMEEAEDGEYVEFKDYRAMEERLAALEIMVDAAKSAGYAFAQKAPYTENCVECLVPASGCDSCAASPWSYDMDAAPRDGTRVLLAWEFSGRIYIEAMTCDEDRDCWWNEDRTTFTSGPFAWAAINLPEAPK